MQTILVLGAGLSTTTLVSYLLEQAGDQNWTIRLGDINEELAQDKINRDPRGMAFRFDASDETARDRWISAADLVVSMLPPGYHALVAASCVKHRRHMVTASYVSGEIRKMDGAAKSQDVLLLNEMGVDPGIDHMSAKKLIDRIRREGGRLDVFESNTGGLVAPGSDDNPWNYKFTWNPRNLVLSGQDGARFLHNGKFKYIPYHKLFQRYEMITILDLGDFEVYPNRDSLTYQQEYGLQDISTMFRGTIRRKGFCEAWDALVQLGATDDSYIVEFPPGSMSYRDFTNAFLAYNIDDPVEKKICDYLSLDPEGEVMRKLQWLGLFDRRKAGVQDQTPARILQHLMEEKLRLEPHDRDMIVMQHQFEYLVRQERKRLVASMAFIGTDNRHTAMSMTVGLPVAVAAKLILHGRIRARGVRIPTIPEVYEPVLAELETFGIRFIEEYQHPRPLVY